MRVEALSAAELRAHVAAVCRKDPEARVVGIRSAAAWTGPPTVTIGDNEVVDVAGCVSPLEVREALAERGPGSRRLVIVTPLADREVGIDVLARLARRRLLQPEPWRLVMELFRARDIDPRLLGHRWIADALLEAAPPEGYPPVAAGVLDAETAWGVLLAERIGLPTARPDVLAVLRWSAAPSRVAELPADARQGIRAWIAETAGPAGALVFECAAGGSGADAVAIGLVLGVVSGQPADQGADLRLREAAVRLERFFGGHRPAAHEARGWAEAAAQLVLDTIRRDDRRLARQWIDRAGALLAELGAADQAWRSPWLAGGLEQRIDRFALALGALVDEPGGAGAREAAAGAFAEVRAHGLSGWQGERRDRLAMALRAAQWLADARTASGAASFGDAVRRYAGDESFVDWARADLRGADPSEEVRAALDRLQAGLRERREEGNARFASLLANWLELGHEASLLTIERILDEVVVPAAAAAPVLLVVMDGMSLAVCHELLAAIERDGWVPVNRREDGAVQPVLAAFPTITEVCRASLLGGTLGRGLAADEKAAFAAHAGLGAAAGSRRPPLLLHKADLSDGAGGLSARAAGEVASPDRRVVGVVLNAVDDHLLKADGVRPHWTPDYVQLLARLLHAARAARRLVVLTSDHGHVLDDGTAVRPGGEADRWRADRPAAGEGEITLAGPRVVGEDSRVGSASSRVVGEGSRIVAAWSERVRYRAAKNGYHGGASPQEAVVPLVVLAPREPVPGDWVEQRVLRPSWWDLEPVVPETERVAARMPAEAPVQPESKTPLLDLAERPAQREAAAGTGAATGAAVGSAAAGADSAGWIDHLLASRRLAEQRRSAGRVPLADERIRLLLGALDERGGRTTREALAARAGLPVLRLAGQLAALRQLLNVDGYAVLTIDEGSDTIEVNVRLLSTQFEL